MKVIIAEGAAYPTGAYDTMAAFEPIGITKIAKKWDVDLNAMTAWTLTSTVASFSTG